MTLGSHQKTIGVSQIYITPRWILDALGSFDLDPCAANPRPWDCAKENFSARGLDRAWQGRVWLNPPFHRYQVSDWIERLARHGDGIALVHARTETVWFEHIWEKAHGLLFLAGRVIFCKPDGSLQTVSGPTSKHFGKPANSGAPIVLAAFGCSNVATLSDCKLPGWFVPSWNATSHAEAA